MSKREFVVGAVIAMGVLGFLIGVLVGHAKGEEYERRAAVRAGAAEWVADPETGAAVFRYISESEADQ